MALISIVFGTRPEAIKLAPVIRKFKEKQTINLRVICTGQHEDLTKPIMDIFKIKEEMFSKAQQLNDTSNDTQNTGEYVYTNLFAKLWKIIILSIFVIN